MSKLIVLISGRKQAGKSTLANQIAALYLNPRHKSWEATVDGTGRLLIEHRPFGRPESPRAITPIDIGPGGTHQGRFYGDNDVRILSFADPLKRFCIDVLGLDVDSCYGTDADKNRPTHIRWEGLSWGIRWKYRISWWKFRTGAMTGREVMQIFGSDLVRVWFPNAWANAAIKEALSCPQSLVLMPDCRFPNELGAGKCEVDSLRGIHVKTIRMKRVVSADSHISETALDCIPDKHFDVIIPANLSIAEVGDITTAIIHPWFEEAGIALVDSHKENCHDSRRGFPI